MNRLDSVRDLQRWVAGAPAGTVAEFHKGNLERDRQRLPGLDAMIRRVGQFVRHGQVRLFAVEVRPGVTAYRLERTSVADASPHRHRRPHDAA